MSEHKPDEELPPPTPPAGEESAAPGAEEAFADSSQKQIPSAVDGPADAAGEDAGSGAAAMPLLPGDPPRIGDFWLDARLTATPAGVAYLAHGDEGQVMLLVLSAGAAQEPTARERFAGEVNKLHIDTVLARGGQGQDAGRLAHRYRHDEHQPPAPGADEIAPWVALAHDGSAAAVAEAHRILRAVDLEQLAFTGSPAGPDYELAWVHDTRPGGWRAWPLPWPGRTDRAGWMTILVSWLLMILTAALALLIAVLLFQNQPPAPPPPPLPSSPPPSSQSSPSPPPSGSPTPSSSSSGAPKPSSASPSRSSGSPSPSRTPSGSPSPSSASPSASGSPTPSPSIGSPTMETPKPSGSASGPGGSPSPNKRL